MRLFWRAEWIGVGLIKKSYQVVAEELLKMIENGLLKPGDRIPTIDSLAEQYGVGKSTIREALSQLKARGLIEARQGEGTYVKMTASEALRRMRSQRWQAAPNDRQLAALVEFERAWSGRSAPLDPAGTGASS